jgi:serine/threonine protein kinase
VGDFGLSKMKDEGKTMTSVGSPLWIAPEVLKGEVYGQGCDIYRYIALLPTCSPVLLPFCQQFSKKSF